jgi:CubicO group peptidase (beta-lactamase class C family)
MDNSKTNSSIVLALLKDKGLLDYNEKVSTYWPEFWQNGKNNITVAEVLRHDAKLDMLKNFVMADSGFTANVKKNEIGKLIEKMSIVD